MLRGRQLLHLQAQCSATSAQGACIAVQQMSLQEQQCSISRVLPLAAKERNDRRVVSTPSTGRQGWCEWLTRQGGVILKDVVWQRLGSVSRQVRLQALNGGQVGALRSQLQSSKNMVKEHGTCARTAPEQCEKMPKRDNWTALPEGPCPT